MGKKFEMPHIPKPAELEDLAVSLGAETDEDVLNRIKNGERPKASKVDSSKKFEPSPKDSMQEVINRALNDLQKYDPESPHYKRAASILNNLKY